MSESAQVLTFGPEAAILARTHGTVTAVLRNALYLEADSGEITGVVGPRGPNGPISLRARGLDALLASPGVRAGAKFTGDGAAIEIDGAARIDLRGAVAWEPLMPFPGATTSALLAADTLAEAIRSHGTTAGFGPLAGELVGIARAQGLKQHEQPPGATEPLRRMASERIRALAYSFMDLDERSACAAAVSLLGLGPGLTPSADDFLCGLLAVARWTGETSHLAQFICGRVASVVLAEAPARTTRLSARLLIHAANGLLYEPAMELGWATLAGRRTQVPAAATRLFALGHTSGVDLSTGILFGTLLLAASHTPPA